MRPTFAKHPDPIEIPDLLSLQTESFDWLVGAPAWRAIAGAEARTGLDEVCEEISPIEDSANAAQEILQGIKRGEFDIHFPKGFTRFLKFLRLLPYPLYFYLVRRFVKI